MTQPPLLAYAAALAPVLEPYLPPIGCGKLALLHSELGVFMELKRQRAEADLRDLALRMFRGLVTPHMRTSWSGTCGCKECRDLRVQQMEAHGYTWEGWWTRAGDVFSVRVSGVVPLNNLNN